MSGRNSEAFLEQITINMKYAKRAWSTQNSGGEKAWQPTCFFKCFDDCYLLDPYHVLGILFLFHAHRGFAFLCTVYHMCTVLEEATGPSRTGVVHGCESCGCWEPTLGPLESSKCY